MSTSPSLTEGEAVSLHATPPTDSTASEMKAASIAAGPKTSHANTNKSGCFGEHILTTAERYFFMHLEHLEFKKELEKKNERRIKVHRGGGGRDTGGPDKEL